MEMMLNRIIPEVCIFFPFFHIHSFSENQNILTILLFFFREQGLPYRHSCEGPDDMVGTFFLVWLVRKLNLDLLLNVKFDVAWRLD